ncbi:MAG: hypothetical protein HUJ26_06155 [Planctomycetaceae bacterium]|nr:hypothetical protein [Planctomycetaceae bacterium]
MPLTLNRPFLVVSLVLLCWMIAPAAGLVQPSSQEDPKTESTEPAEKPSADSDKQPKDKQTSKSRHQPKEETPEERRKRIRDRAQNSMGAVTNLIAIPQIQQELDLSDEQRGEISDQIKSMQLYLRMQFKEVRDLPRSEQAAQIRKLKTQTAAPVQKRQQQILEILTDEQRMRLTGISMQYRGVECLLDDKIADLLKLTEEQREELITIAEKLDMDLSAERRKLLEVKPEDRRTQRKASGQRQQKLRATAEEEMLAVLTPEQLEKFEELQGKKFRVRSPKAPTPIRPVEPSKKDE